jgi:hypothetical protein
MVAMGKSKFKKWIALALVLIPVSFIAYEIYCTAVPVRWIYVKSGHAGVFEIGETQGAIISRLPDESFSPQPKPPECPRNWIGSSDMTVTERNCLLSTDVWIEGVSSMRSQCPNLDMETTLRFKDKRLASVTTVCRHGL